MKPKSRARMVDVAERANVALVTVSRVLNESPAVSPATREKVLAAIEELGYVPNLVAGSLASSQTGMIAIVVPTIGNPVFSETVEAMSNIFRSVGFEILLGTTGEPPGDESRLIENFLARRPDGMLIHGSNPTGRTRRLLASANIPIVQSGDLEEHADPVDMVVAYSNFRGAKAMTEHLLEMGCRKIAFVGRQFTWNDRSFARQRGYRAALTEHGLAVDESIVLECDLGFTEGTKALLKIKSRTPDVDAIFFAGDVWAAGALFECVRQGLSVPEDIAIAGFDDHAIAGVTAPRLSTIRVPRYEIGERAAQMLLQRISGGQTEDAVVDVGFELVVRDSTNRKKR
jgi:LacI family transcriptional regulator, gluconate utilization system Gnt-I transcriptional repressor